MYASLFYHNFFACATDWVLHTTAKTGTIELQQILRILQKANKHAASFLYQLRFQSACRPGLRAVQGSKADLPMAARKTKLQRMRNDKNGKFQRRFSWPGT